MRDIATVRYGPEIRRGAADWNARGEAVGGIVVMRIGSNALEVIEALKREIAELSLAGGRSPRAYVRSLGAHSRFD